MNMRNTTAILATMSMLDGCGGGGGSRVAQVPVIPTTPSQEKVLATRTVAFEEIVSLSAACDVGSTVTSMPMQFRLLWANFFPRRMMR